MKSHQLIVPSEFDITKFSLVPQARVSSSNTKYMYPAYEEDGKSRQLKMLTGEVNLQGGGIFPYSENYHPGGVDDVKRAFFHMQLEEGSDLLEMIEKLDNYYHEEININHNKNRNVSYAADNGIRFPKQLRYKPMIFEKEFQEITRKFVKVNLDVDFNPQIDAKSPRVVQKINTMVFEEGKLVRTKYLSSFDQYLNWRNTCALCIGVNKMVIYQDPANPKERVCSLGLKCYQIDVLGGKDEGRPIHLKYNMFTGEELS